MFMINYLDRRHKVKEWYMVNSGLSIYIERNVNLSIIYREYKNGSFIEYDYHNLDNIYQYTFFQSLSSVKFMNIICK